MFMNECGMLTAIDKTVKFRSLVPMNTKQNKEYYRALNAILRHYNQAGFMIKTIHCDGEYKAMMDQVRDDLDIVMNYTNGSDHVPEAGETTKPSRRESGQHTEQESLTKNQSHTSLNTWPESRKTMRWMQKK